MDNLRLVRSLTALPTGVQLRGPDRGLPAGWRTLVRHRFETQSLDMMVRDPDT